MSTNSHLWVHRLAAAGIAFSIPLFAAALLQPPTTAKAAVPAPSYAAQVGDVQYIDGTTPTPVPTTVPGEGGDTDALGSVKTIIFDIVKTVIGLCYLAMILIFAVGTVKNATVSLLAQKAGMQMMMSNELMNWAGGVVIFLAGLASIPIVNWIIDKAGTLITNVSVHVPGTDPSMVISTIVPGK